MRFFDVAVERFKVEFELAHVFGLKLLDFELDCHHAGEAPMEEKEIEFKILGADLYRVMAADKAEVAAEFDEEILEAFDETAMEVGFGVAFGEVEEFNEIGVFEDGGGIGMQNCQRC